MENWQDKIKEGDTLQAHYYDEPVGDRWHVVWDKSKLCMMVHAEEGTSRKPLYEYFQHANKETYIGMSVNHPPSSGCAVCPIRIIQ